jgi:hypothetical protein
MLPGLPFLYFIVLLLQYGYTVINYLFNEISTLSFRIILSYVIPCLISGLGVFQAAAAYNNLRGILFFKDKVISSVLAGILIVPPLWYLGTWNRRNATGIIEGSQQAGLFFASMLVALIITLVLSSIINRHLRQSSASARGLEALRDATFFQLMRRWWTG